MPIGSKGKVTFSSYTDEYTGVKVRRLTDPTVLSHHMYFYNRMMTADGGKLLICQELSEGRQIYLLDTATGDTLQLTEGTNLSDDSGILANDENTVFYVQDGKVFSIKIDSLKKELIYEAPKGYGIGNVGIGSDNKYLVFTETEKSTTAPVGNNWNFFAANCLAKPHCRITMVEIETKKSKMVLEDNCWFGHAQLRPGDNDTILFCHEGPYDLIDARLWLVQSDGSNLRCCKEQPNDLILTHEFWLPDGSKLAFVYRETTGDKIENIRMIDPVTMEETILMPCSPFAHFICDKECKYMVGDSQGIDKPIHLLTMEEIEADRKAGIIRNDFIYIIDVEKREEKKLCYHGTSWLAVHGSTQDAHPHPCFSEDNSKVIFVSDREGKPCVYCVEID